MAWLNCCLIQYSLEKGILPGTQVAVQPGVQTRDLMSFLAGVKCWANRHKELVYALKRDQMKGFDYLAPEGFHDAVCSYGLLQSIVDIDKAAHKETKCFIRTAYRVTVPIIVSDVNKQGGPLSPIKSTFTTSLGHYYLNDLMRNDSDTLIVLSSARKRNDPHLKDDGNCLMVAMVEATDDSFLFSRSLPSLRRNALAMERFQAKVDNPTAHFEELRNFIETFQFPHVLGRLPITLIRKIVAQNIVSKCRAMLYLQPIKQSDAEALDRQITEKVHLALGFPFRPSLRITTLPLSHHGFDFPSITRINAGIVVVGISQDLNHHIHMYQTMARIMMADWTCEKNGCVYLLDGDGLQKGFSHYMQSIPAGWVIAQKVMKDLLTPLSLRMTDQSSFAGGEVSLLHVVNVCNHRNPQKFADLNGNTLRSLRTKGIQSLQDVGRWVITTSDGSMKLASATIEEEKVVLGATTGALTLVLKIPGHNVSILHDEQIGLIIALILTGWNSDEAQFLLTNHQNSVRLIKDKRMDMNIKYMHAHTDKDTMEARMNRDADFYMSQSHEIESLVPQSPIPTFHMNDYTFYQDGDGWIESNIGDFINLLMVHEMSTKLGIGNRHQMSTWAHDQSSPPDFPYLRVTSTHLAAVQLYVRSSQLLTADVLVERGKLSSDRCRLGCDEIEDMHHVFVYCKMYSEWRAEAGASVVEWTQYFTLPHEFRQTPADSHRMSEFHPESTRMVGISNSSGFHRIMNGIPMDSTGF
ncbi:uncharacterized protein LACBIDRAFT_329991 [Laccaria bicolor S238N-H82]|uniref:Predicted protein n=1 Tax=Laccaria bicolor (strain S238N-H82 / ATCC MYA-4686) TaxID=486041 RepID=B0DJV0_LACBS|nr:uncharacterized protein LACBIDRAFT_329991 [Laccaria bicolor S238N-H82]EDR05270.1 predicted protein [Laccaria bicolor S238N-H82]|eukprot:XP_001884235.1 predicted protein [Laccaria bicolor S238N-H82]